MRLTNFGRTFLVRTGAIVSIAILLIGGTVLELGLAHILGLNQQLYNVLFITFVLPICISLMSVWYYDELDRKNAESIQSECKG